VPARVASHPRCMSKAADLIVVVSLYVLGMGLFQVLGGLGAAAEVLKSWGRASSTVRQPDNNAL
jgi:hypothetical protein